MKALRFYAPLTSDWRTPEPECSPDEISCGCATVPPAGPTVKIFHNGHQNLTPPRTIGHQIAGEVVGRVRSRRPPRPTGRLESGTAPRWTSWCRAVECHECRKGLDGGLPEPDLPVGCNLRRRVRRVHDRPRQVLQVGRSQRIPTTSGTTRRPRPSPSPARSTPRSCSGSSPLTLSWCSAPAPSAACTSGIVQRRPRGRPGLPVDVNAEAAEDVRRRRLAGGRSTLPRSTSSSAS